MIPRRPFARKRPINSDIWAQWVSAHGYMPSSRRNRIGVCGAGLRRNSGGYPRTIERRDELDQVVSRLVLDLRELNAHTGEQQKALGLIASPGHSGFRLVLFPRAVGKRELDGEFRAGRQRLTALDEESS